MDKTDLIGRIAALRADGASSELARALRELGELERRDDPDAARRHYEEAVGMYREVDEPLRLAHTIRHLGDILVDADRIAEAEACYDEALTIYRARGDTAPLELANAVRGMAVLEQKNGARENALRLWQEAHDLYVATGVEEGARETATRIRRLRDRL
jgi:tetratricopeptide (TPR) repeat protein